MAVHAVVALAAFCVFGAPAVDQVAGALPKFPPLALAAAVVDLGCGVVLRVPPLKLVITLIGDAAQYAKEEAECSLTRRSRKK
jgi:hypothetical protein